MWFINTIVALWEQQQATSVAPFYTLESWTRLALVCDWFRRFYLFSRRCWCLLTPLISLLNSTSLLYGARQQINRINKTGNARINHLCAAAFTYSLWIWSNQKMQLMHPRTGTHKFFHVKLWFLMKQSTCSHTFAAAKCRAGFLAGNKCEFNGLISPPHH